MIKIVRAPSDDWMLITVLTPCETMISIWGGGAGLIF